ncbi:DUF4344 domain-containing metallopeptidase [Actibacterium sp. 188UL27-1]|uniref:DUF4344 domain-containing metallopeptidase n=1 Tax=Actibacterium sp. 188UL27-1 TaxID=2786961 RepID=UPI001EF48EB3|nr:DUF4344 domain-containing metallopeptidase [Actibacterium sp. 188UL27-1]
MRLSRLLLSLALLACPAVAEEAEQNAFVEGNIIGIFYHELGHAVIDLEGVPIFGQEEDAADTFSIFMIHALFEEETAQDLAYDVSFGFWAEADLAFENEEDVAWWDEHGPDEQRFYNTICIFYGGDPDARADLAADLDLPEERAEQCPFEFDQAEASWGTVLDELVDRGPGETLVFDGDDSLTGQILAQEVEDLNAMLSLSAPLQITVESCGESNAFYDAETVEIIMCAEFEDHLFKLADRL